MRKSVVSTAIVAGLALGVAMGCSAQADSSTDAPESSSPASAPSSRSMTPPATPASAAPECGQAQIADLTGRLEDAFAKQFEQNAIDQAALEKLIAQTVQAFPQAAQEKVRIHIDSVFEMGKKVAPQMGHSERVRAITPPEKLGRTQQALLTSWGWGGGRGFGGFGAFGFPATYYWGYPATYSSLYPGLGFYGTGLGCGWGGAWCGTGLGLGGWYW